MSIRFSADEIFEIAEKIEKNGVAFYKTAANNFKGTKTENLLLKLAAMEEEHRIIFSAMRAEVTEEENETTIFDPDDELKEYLRAIADGNVFDITIDPASKLTGSETEEEIIHIAIGLEKDSIIFYLGIKDMVPERLGRSKIQGIIEEERKHIVVLSDTLTWLNKK
jgi:rubrerythrin